MPLFFCRWPDGDCSLVLARTRDEAIIVLDEEGNAERCPITRLRTFQIRLTLTDRGDLVLARFGDGTDEEIVASAYPLLEQARDEARRRQDHEHDGELTRRGRAAIKRAVERERSRSHADETPTPEPQTEFGRQVKHHTDMPTVLIDRLVRAKAMHVLRKVRSRGTKPS